MHSSTPPAAPQRRSPSAQAGTCASGPPAAASLPEASGARPPSGVRASGVAPSGRLASATAASSCAVPASIPALLGPQAVRISACESAARVRPAEVRIEPPYGDRVVVSPPKSPRAREMERRRGSRRRVAGPMTRMHETPTDRARAGVGVGLPTAAPGRSERAASAGGARGRGDRREHASAPGAGDESRADLVLAAGRCADGPARARPLPHVLRVEGRRPLLRSRGGRSASPASPGPIPIPSRGSSR